MATIKYCSWATGDDTTGDGTASLPYKTITKASTGLTGGDEVRVAKSPEPTNLTGTLGFTNNSTAVVGTNTLFTTELAIGDFIKGGNGYWWEVVVITNDTHLTLYKVYSGSTASGVSSQKLGITDTGAAASTSDAVQTISASGSSDSSRLKISGGWDLSTETQTGQTFFRQMHTTFDNRYGYGLYATGKYFFELSRLHLLRYYHGIYLSNSSNNNDITTPTCNSNGSHGIYLVSSSNNNITSPTCNSNNSCGIYLSNSSNNNDITTPTCNSNGSYGIYLGGSFNNNITSPTCNSNGSYGIYLAGSSDNDILGTLTTSGNTSGAIYNNNGTNYINKASIGESTKVGGFTNYANSRIFINDISGNSQIWTDYANAVMQNATAGGTGKEWKLSITGANRAANYPFGVVVAAIPVNASKQVTVRLYFKKSGTGIAGRLFIKGGHIAGVDSDVYANCPDDTNRNQVTLTFTPTEKGVVEIEAQAWYVSSTSQNIIVDDIDISQAD